MNTIERLYEKLSTKLISKKTKVGALPDLLALLVEFLTTFLNGCLSQKTAQEVLDDARNKPFITRLNLRRGFSRFITQRYSEPGTWSKLDGDICIECMVDAANDSDVTAKDLEDLGKTPDFIF